MQASFDPPGLTVAVKRDRAVENLMNRGSQFVVNILGEGSHKQLMKQLLKSFKPGEDRFAGLDIKAGYWPLSDRTGFTCFWSICHLQQAAHLVVQGCTETLFAGAGSVAGDAEIVACAAGVRG